MLNLISRMTFFIHYNNRNIFIKFDSIINNIVIIVQNKTSIVLETEININSDFCIIPFKSPKGQYKITLTIGNNVFNRTVLVG